jgi:acetyl-CoA carboxylase biotin carboxylase subunit
MFRRVLVANRGEIALRIIRTLKEMGIETIAVYSDADKEAPHCMEADRRVHIGPREPINSYLNMERIIEAAKQQAAEAIHPGYGFLAENPNFARACEDEGIVFIGPPSEVIEALGDKIWARKIAMEAGLPVIPGMLVATKDLRELKRGAEDIGYPLMLKAAMGGGGKGMRIVNTPEELEEAAESAMREAEQAFKDGSIYLERLLVRPRHVEFQVLADSKGNVVHLFERECSIQRRHQKIIEETPSPLLSPGLREEMGEAARKIMKASGYVNSGTVEFLVDQTGAYYFLEVNTRLQVEHPITELTVGVDMVRHQVEIAYGLPLSLRQEELKQRGHAIECRIYAEDPAHNFMPSAGKILSYEEPKGPWVRVDSGVSQGYEVPIEYDPIISKVIVWAENRGLAIEKMIRALEEYVITGVTTSIPFLLDIMRSEEFKLGNIDTKFVAEFLSDWDPPQRNKNFAIVTYVLDQIFNKRKANLREMRKDNILSPWQTLGSWHL